MDIFDEEVGGGGFDGDAFVFVGDCDLNRVRVAGKVSC
jgi:hypothetical protein